MEYYREIEGDTRSLDYIIAPVNPTGLRVLRFRVSDLNSFCIAISIMGVKAVIMIACSLSLSFPGWPWVHRGSLDEE